MQAAYHGKDVTITIRSRNRSTSCLPAGRGCARVIARTWPISRKRSSRKP
ncbi:hypothetical protein [Pseudoglutamicibacter cumminsii]